jgi:uncharacterized damage-inducible protein DinB
MSERIQKIKGKLVEGRSYLNAVLDRVGDRWDEQVYTHGAGWSVHGLLIHLVVSDRGQLETIKRIAKGGEGVPPDFDLERYNRRSVEKRSDKTVEEARVELRQSRQDLQAWLDGLEDESMLDLKGRHGSLRILSIEEILHVIADHDIHHARDIAKALNIEV